jgi:hypothetical protein
MSEVMDMIIFDDLDWFGEAWGSWGGEMFEKKKIWKQSITK